MTTFSRRGPLVVVCLATAMLMLDIAVVNTALGHGSGAAYVNGLHHAIYVAVAIAALGAIASRG